MSYQAYIDAVRKKTGKSMDEFHELARQRGLLEPGKKAGEVVAWLKSDFGLGHGHATAVYGVLRSAEEPKLDARERVDAHFAGRSAAWKSIFDRVMAVVSGFGADVSVKPGDAYLSLLRKGKKFAIVKAGAGAMDVGLKRKGVAPTGRFKASGSWNTMVTHRVRLRAPAELDEEVFAWLRSAYAEA